LRYKITPEKPIPESWTRVSDIAKDARRIIVMGETDVGKSGLTLYLANSLINSGYKVGIVDSDIGQSDIGPPTTIGLSILDHPYPTYWDLPLTEAYFVGDKSPAGHLLPMVVGTGKMVDKALELGADIVVVNTTGYVHGGPARALKRFKIEAIDPDLIVLLERDAELAHFRAMFKHDRRIYRAEVPTTLRRKTRGERITFRNISLSRYFTNPMRFELDISSIRLINLVTSHVDREDEYLEKISSLSGYKPIAVLGDRSLAIVVFEDVVPRELFLKIRKALSPDFSEVRLAPLTRYRGLISALYKNNHFLGLARVEDVDFKSDIIIISADVEDIESITEVHVGYIALDENYMEKATLRPGQGLI
jgi:polynucleotide 5'-hydroxyl-kinase GRC3/NOL9